DAARAPPVRAARADRRGGAGRALPALYRDLTDAGSGARSGGDRRARRHPGELSQPVDREPLFRDTAPQLLPHADGSAHGAVLPPGERPIRGVPADGAGGVGIDRVAAGTSNETTKSS